MYLKETPHSPYHYFKKLLLRYCSIKEVKNEIVYSKRKYIFFNQVAISLYGVYAITTIIFPLMHDYLSRFISLAGALFWFPPICLYWDGLPVATLICIILFYKEFSAKLILSMAKIKLHTAKIGQCLQLLLRREAINNLLTVNLFGIYNHYAEN